MFVGAAGSLRSACTASRTSRDGEHRPDLHHQAVVVGQLADLAVVLALAQVVHQPRRRDDRLRLENRCRAGDPGQRVQCLRDRVHLGLVLAVGAEPLPEERDRVEPQHLDAGVGEEQDDVGVLLEHIGVGPVEVPLPFVERRPDPALQVVVPGEVARGEVGKHLGQRRLVRVGHRAVWEDLEVGPLRRHRRRGPPTAQRCSRATWLSTRSSTRLIPWPRSEALSDAQVVHRAEVGPYGAVVGDRVAAVVVAVPRQQQRHQVQVGDAELLEVGDPLAHAGQVAGEPVGIGGVAEHARRLEPVRLRGYGAGPAAAGRGRGRQ